MASLVIIDDLDGIRPRWRPAEADAPLVVDADAVLPFPIPLQGFQTITGRNAQIVQASCGMHLIELARSQGCDRLRNAPDELAVEDRLGVLVLERPDRG